jgi:hypothetical protein
MLNEERLSHRATREALTFEVSRHKETTELLERVFGEANRALDVAQGLEFEIATLEAAKAIRTDQPQLMIGASPDGDRSPHSSGPVNQMTISSICTSNSIEPGSSAEERGEQIQP